MTVRIPESGAEPPYVSKIDRRTAIAWVGAASVGAAGVLGAAAVSRRSRAPVQEKALGYGVDPKLTEPSAPWPRLMTPLQLQTTALLCDHVLPASGGHPSAREVGVPDFMDEWVSAPYPEQLADRGLILKGLDALEGAARRRGSTLAALPPGFREALFQGVGAPPPVELSGRAETLARLLAGPVYDGLTARARFYRRFRLLTAGAYYTTEAGFKDIGYLGNVALQSYPGVSDEVKAILDQRLKALRV